MRGKNFTSGSISRAQDVHLWWSTLNLYDSKFYIKAHARRSIGFFVCLII